VQYDALIVGGGVIGCSIAYQLAKRNKKVIVLEKGNVAGKASSAAAGMLGAQMEFSFEDPLYPLAIKSRDMFRSLSQELYKISGIDIEWIEEGIYQLAFTEDEAAHFQKQAERGKDAHWLNTKQLMEREPALSEKTAGALFLPRDGQVAPEKLTKAYMKAAMNLGAELLEHTEIVSLIKEGGRVTGVQTKRETLFAKNTILAGGVWSGGIDQSLEMIPVRGECMSFKTKKPLIKGTLKYKSCYLVPKRGDRLILGATSVPNSFDESVSYNGIFQLMEQAKKIVPGIMDSVFERAWAGIRPQTKSGVPYIGPHPHYDQLYAATGHYRNGILLSPVTGTLIADQILQKERQVYANEASN
jgi:glycine oxidase